MLKIAALHLAPVLVLGGPQGHGATVVHADDVAADSATFLFQAWTGEPSQARSGYDPVSLSRVGRPARRSRRRPDKDEEEKGPHAKVDCSEQPYACSAPFFCHRVPSEKDAERRQVATSDGHADWSAWCDSPYLLAARECAAGNMTGYGSLMRQIQHKFSMGGNGLESLDAHYCFSFGHCDDDEVTELTTLQRAEAICDRRFGHAEWTTLEFDATMSHLAFAPEGDMHLSSDGSMYLGPKAEFAFAKMSCAMGSFHCDVSYCKQQYCLQPEFIEKYGSLRPSKDASRQVKRRSHGFW